MSRQLLEREPVAATEDERQALLQLQRALSCQSEQAPKLVGPDGEIALPEGLSRVLRAAIHVMLCRDAVSVVPIHRELTTQEAADLLNISRPSLVRLLDNGEIPHTRLGAHRRVRFEDVMALKRRQNSPSAHLERQHALAELTRISEESFSREAELTYYREMHAGDPDDQ